ncbi:LuxR C-terminal-related transcriptional regulator [Pseudonocardia sp. TRM90224]|uniref:LuxR C-terminal-related transcriptional regulator n=1 Tax=Pseudonocardia sp. TRM90224 TaxID=2812678 RepID=UPI001E5AA0CF|nr:LuxR family transcriptional regulator [Pseudonocardia sp. TRM90224]
MELLERADATAVLRAGAAEAADGRGGVVVVSGEWGAGRSSLVRAWSDGVPLRVLRGTCDDLLGTRALGPLREAVAGTAGPLENALLTGADCAFAGVIAELGGTPAVLVVDDLHRADPATLDVLCHLAKRITELPALLVATVADGGAPPEHPVWRWLGGLATVPVRRVELRPLSVDAVAVLAAGSPWDVAQLHTLTGGNPFLVTEAIAAGPAERAPAAVTDAVVARMQELGSRCSSALAQLSVMPERVPFELVDTLLGTDVHALDAAEAAGFLDVRPSGVAFRHELVRRAVEESRPQLRRRALHRCAFEALRSLDRPDPARSAYHAARAGDAPATAGLALEAARQAAAGGAREQALGRYEQAVALLAHLQPADACTALEGYAAELCHASRLTEAAHAANRAVELQQRNGDATAARMRSARYHLLAGATAEALELGRSAAGSRWLIAGGGRGETELRETIERGSPECAAQAYCDLAELLLRAERLGELDACLSAGAELTGAHGFGFAACFLAVHRCLLDVRRGAWDTAGTGLAALRDGPAELGLLQVPVDAAHARLLARRGAPEAEDAVRSVWERAGRQRTAFAIGHAGTALLEWVWLAGRGDVDPDVLDGWPAAVPLWAELRRYAIRAGLDVGGDSGPVPSLDPYETALENAETGGVETTLDALRTLDGLGAVAAARIARRRLRELGMRTIPRGPQATTRAHPAGLTSRQADVLDLMADGLTNAEIAGRLVLSVRTVDHHVSTILTKLGVPNRRHATRVARTLVAAPA